MTTICLTNYSSSYFAGNVTITVKCEGYKCSNLFHRYEHQLKTPTAGKIYLYNGSYYFSSYLYNYATLDPENGYKSSKLDKVCVYANRFDSTKSFLVLVFCFKNGSSTAVNRYYPYTNLDPKKGATTMKINSLHTFKEESDILCPLLEENDKLDKVLTYDIMKMPAPNNGNGNNTCKYNCNKISVTNDTSTSANGEPKVGAGFTRYKHTPVTNSNGNNNNGGNDNAGKQACVIYRCQTLVGANGTQAQAQELPHIQNQKYAHIRVYFGCRAKRPPPCKSGKSAGACPAPSTSGTENTACKPGSTACSPATGQDTCPPAPTEPTAPCNQDVPLLLELHKQGGKNGATGANPQYYAHVRKNGAQETGDNGADKYYWVKLPCKNGATGRTNGTQNTLKNLLDDIGLSTTNKGGASHNNGHETLQALLKQALNGNGDGSDGANGDLTDNLKQLKGDKLRKLLGQPVNGSPGENGQNTLITLLLKRVEFDITDSLVVLLNRRPNNAGHNGVADGYGDSQIQSAISGLEPNGRGTRVNRLKLNGAGGDTKPIKVTDVTTSNGDTSTVCKCLAKCFAKYGYCLIEHDFGNAVNSKLGQGCSAGLRLLIPAMSNGRGNGGCQTKYAELRLYDDATKTDPAHLQYLYYTKGAGSEGSAACTTACTTSTTGHTCSKTQDAQICSRLYVVFYKGVDGTVGRTSGSAGTGDPRPLLLGYGGCWYRPKDKDGYFDTWVQIPGLDDKGACQCNGGGASGTECKTHQALLKALTTTVGFLNQVNLFEHPKGTAGGEGAQTQCQPCEPGAAGATATCQALTSGQTTVKCTYEVHKFDGKQIKVQVECQDVPNTQPSESTAQTCSQSASSGCYRKLTHKPAGMGNGATNGFRLGDVVYRPNPGSDPQGSIKYYGNGSDSVGNGNISADHKWSPLLQVTAYFYKHDTGYCDPLLVELQFAKVDNGLQNGANDNKEYYRLKTRNGSGGKLEWERDTDCAKDLVAKPECLTRYLDAIRYCLKKVVRIQLEKNKAESYALTGRNAKNGQGRFSPIKNGVPPTNGKIDVKVCECQCPALTARKYKCLKHGLTEALKPVHYQVAGLVFTLPGRNGDTGADKAVEIPVCVVGQGEAECPPGATEGLCTTTAPAAGTCPAVTGAPSTCSPGQTTAEIPPVHYNQCMGDICVYFYGQGGTGGGSTDTTDTVPLMLRYNGQFYKPYSRDQYFTKWVPVTALCKTAGECKGGCACCCPGVRAADPGTSCGAHGPSGDGADCPPECPCCSQLVTELDRVNECLNRVDLDKSRLANNGGSSGAGTGYGLPENRTGSSFKTDRVTLVKQEPTGADAKKAYVKVVHRTKNGFRIGAITYCCKEITQDGVTPTALSNGQCDGPGSPGGASCSASPAAAGTTGNGTIKIEVAKGTGGPNGNGHKNLVNENGWNTVVVYYSTSDKCYRLPQLIVLLHTDAEVKNSEVVTGSADKKYGYYILATKNGSTGGGVSGSTGYAYQWREVENGSKTPVTLDDKTDFSLLNAAFILLDLRVYSCCTYGEDRICQAITTAIQNQSLKESPGYTGQVNRLKNRDITVKDETKDTVTCSGTSPGTCCCKCLDGTGFKVMSHNIDQLVNLNGPFKPPLCKINLIAGLKLLIPTGERAKYRQVTLNGDAAGAQNGSVRYHHPDNGNKVCVYFYCSDPRPLLVCYNGWAYRAKDMAAYNEQKWTQCIKLEGADAAKCCCPGAQQPPPPGTCDKCPLIKALVGVSDFLNPVDVKQVPDSKSTTGRRFCDHYDVHRFNGRRVRIRVLAQFACGSFCYHRFTHTHAGITGKGDGFRLGNIHYGGVNSKGEGSEQGGDSTCIKLNGAGGGGANGKCISASHDKNGGLKCGAFPEVVVFYYKGDTKHEHPLLVALRSPDPGWDNKHSPYYELEKKFGAGEQKKYTKNNNGNGIDLGNTSPDGELAKKLDSILFTTSKKLQIVLSTRPVATEYSPDAVKGYSSDQKALEDELKKRRSEKAKLLKEVAKEGDELEKTSKTTAITALTAGKPLATRDSLMHHVTGSTTYKAQLSNGASEPPSGPTTTQIPVEEVHCPGLQPGGYRCFKHDLVNANHIEQVGGLVLCVFAKQTGADAGTQSADAECQPCDTQGSKQGAGKEGLELCTGQTTSDGETGCKNGKNGGKNGKKVELHYTTCKGNLYVFFYGEDPRPLMLCYDKHAYRPVCMADYCKQWVRVNGGSGGAGPTNCMCDDKTFDATKLLPELFRVSVLLNPVYLRLTSEAIAKLKPKRPDQQPVSTNGQQQPSSQSGSADGSSSASGPQAASADYTYPIDQNPPDPVKVRVTTQDLQCYRRYTHKPEREGFRLGVVRYAHPPCPEGAGQGTVVASSNGQCPAQPAPTTTTAPSQGFCFKYDSAKQLQTVCTYYYMYDCAHYWPLVVELGFKGRPSEWWRLCSGPDKGASNGNGAGSAGRSNGGSTAASTGNGSPTTSSDSSDPPPSKPPAQLKWVRMTASQAGTGAGAGQTGTSTGHTNRGTGTGTGDSCKDAPSTQPAQSAATQPGSNGDCTECPPPATGTGAAKPAHNGNGNHGTHTAAQTGQSTAGQTHAPEEQQKNCEKDAAFARDAREIENKLGKTVLGIPAYPRNYPGLEIDLRELIERRAYEIRKSLGIEYGPKGQDRLIMETDSNCQEESIMAYLVGGGVFGAAGGSGWKLVTMVTGMTVAL